MASWPLFANDTKNSKTNNAVFQPKHVTTKRTRKQVWLKATKPINPGDEIFVTYSRDYWRRQGEDDDVEFLYKMNLRNGKG